MSAVHTSRKASLLHSKQIEAAYAKTKAVYYIFYILLLEYVGHKEPLSCRNLARSKRMDYEGPFRYSSNSLYGGPIRRPAPFSVPK